MSSHIEKKNKSLNQRFKKLSVLCHEAANALGISDNELWVWYALLILKGEYSQQDICDMWSLPKQTVNSIIANLSKKGYLTLEAVPGARNRKVIKVSEEERKMCITLMGKYISYLKDETNEE